MRDILRATEEEEEEENEGLLCSLPHATGRVNTLMTDTTAARHK